MFWVYILKSIKNKKYYVGSTNNYIRRFEEHQSGRSVSTRSLRPFKLCLVQAYNTLSEARKIELKIKNLKRKDYLEKMISDGYIKMSIEDK